MPEDIIKGKIIFDAGGGLTGGGNVAGGGEASQSSSVFTGILGKLGAIAGSTALLAKASPQLSATFGIMFKALMLILRPIGDVISMFLRPMAIALIRFLIPILKKWNQFKKTAVGEVAGTAMGGAMIGGAIGGKIGGLPGAAIGAGIGAAIGMLPKAIQGIKNLWLIVTEWGKFLGEKFGEWIKGVWENITTAFSDFGSWVSENVITPIMDGWNAIVSFVMDNVITPIIDAWIKVWDFINEKVITPIKEAWSAVWTFVSEKFIEPIKKAFLAVYNYIDTKVIEPIKSAWEKIVEWFQTTIIDPVKTKFKTLFDKIQGWIDSLKFWKKKKNKSEDEDDEKQTGGYIGQTGMYKLHQGETVIPAHMQGMTNNFTPNITINANIANNMDLQSLADELSSIMMDNLQRRNSYTFT